MQSSTQVVIVETDVGYGYLKAMGNPEGEHALACDFVGTQLAKWLGLPTLDQVIVDVDDKVDIILFGGGLAKTGPALITRAVPGESWSGTARQLKQLKNRGDISRLVVLDTWLLNRDRHSAERQNRDNVFLCAESKKLELLAIDHTHCFGTAGGEITERISQIHNWKNEAVFGRFLEFMPFLDRKIVTQCALDLSKMDQATVQAIVAKIPEPWNVSARARAALVSLIVQRAKFVANTIVQKLFPQKELDLDPSGSSEA